MLSGAPSSLCPALRMILPPPGTSSHRKSPITLLPLLSRWFFLFYSQTTPKPKSAPGALFTGYLLYAVRSLTDKLVTFGKLLTYLGLSSLSRKMGKLTAILQGGCGLRGACHHSAFSRPSSLSRILPPCSACRLAPNLLWTQQPHHQAR